MPDATPNATTTPLPRNGRLAQTNAAFRATHFLQGNLREALKPWRALPRQRLTIMTSPEQVRLADFRLDNR